MNKKIIEAVIERFKQGKNILITGQAGVGKTYLLNEFLDWLEENKYNVGLAGSTGVAAINIGGTTAHRMFGINKASNVMDFLRIMKYEESARRAHYKRMKEMLKYDVLVIDEVSMIGSKLLELIDYVLKSAMENELPFGGKQIIFSGDFLQLPPINDTFAFESPIWKEGQFSVIHLTKVYRQDDPLFLEVLTKLRIGEYDSQVEEFINERIWEGDVSDDATKLYSRNASVDNENTSMLQELKGKKKIYKSESNGAYSDVMVLTRNINAPKELELKVGAKVMSLKNAEDLSYVNGSIGKVKKLNIKSVTVEFENGITEIIEPWTWTLMDNNGTITASYSQIPLRLAYAITMHKSQGMTIDGELFIDCDGIRNDGQFYVAVSRIKDFNKLKIVNFKREYISANKKAVSFYK